MADVGSKAIKNHGCYIRLIFSDIIDLKSVLIGREAIVFEVEEIKQRTSSGRTWAVVYFER